MEAIYKCSSKYTKDEHMRFEEYAYQHTGRAKRVTRQVAVMVLVAAALVALFTYFDKMSIKTMWLPLMWVVGAVVYAMINGSVGSRISWKMSPQVHDAQQKYFFYADHIEYFIGENGITVPYEAICSMGETDTNIYLMLNDKQGMSIQKNTAPRNLPAFLRDRYKEVHGEENTTK